MVDPDFGPIHLGNPRTEYVAWIDLMGTGAIMEWSQDTATTNIGKLQVIMGECSDSYDLELYPMMDGCYAISDSESDILQFTSDVFERTSKIIVNRDMDRQDAPAYFSPVIRGGIAKGDVYHGNDIDGSDLDDHPIQESILIGRAVARAHSCESDAAPFSCIVHPTGWQKDNFGRLDWCTDKYHAQNLVDALDTYFDYYAGKEDVDYPTEKIRKHRDMAAGALLRREPASD